MMAGIWGQTTHVPLMSTFARFGEVVGISQPEAGESKIPFKRINKKDFDNTGFAQLWVMEKMGLKDVIYWGISEGAATGIAAAARDAQEVVEGKHDPIIKTLVVVAPGGMIKQFPPKVVLNFFKTIAQAKKKEREVAYERAIGTKQSEKRADQEAEKAVQDFLSIGEAYPQHPPKGWRGEWPSLEREKLLNWLWNFWLLSRDVTHDACKKVKCDIVFVCGEKDLVAQPQRHQRGDSMLAFLKERFPNARSVKSISVPHRGHELPVADADLLSFVTVKEILSLTLKEA